MDWNNYLEKTQNRTVQPLLLEALQYVKNPTLALDLGAGALNDSRYLADLGFEVDAVDSNPGSANYLKDTDTHIHLHMASFAAFEYEPLKYSLVSAQYSLPFQPQDEFPITFSKILASLQKEAIITFQLFGKEDSWCGREDVSFHDKEEVQELLRGMQVHKFSEEKHTGTTAMGNEKHWHVFKIIAEKV
jgi:tellurite methyltransferase